MAISLGFLIFWMAQAARSHPRAAVGAGTGTAGVGLPCSSCSAVTQSTAMARCGRHTKCSFPRLLRWGGTPQNPSLPVLISTDFSTFPCKKLSLRGGECSRLDDPAWSGQCHVKGAGAGMWVLPPTLR